MITKVQAVILAAGRSTRFNTGKTKLLEPICGQPMIMYPIRLFEQLSIPMTVVIGHQKEEIKKVVEEADRVAVTFVVQEEQHGTGHALKITRPYWREENILIINGDMPLVTEQIMSDLCIKHQESNAAISFVTSHYAEGIATSYGRVITTDAGIEIVEARNFTGDISEPCCINAGIYIVTKTFLERYIDTVECNIIAQEFYITDLVKIASEAGYTIMTVSVPFDSIRGVNTYQELWAVEHIKRSELIKYWMDNGVRFSMPQNVALDLEVTIGAGTFIGSGVRLAGKTTIGAYSSINDYSLLDNAVIGEGVTVHAQSIINNSCVGSGAQVGPFAYVHNGSVIEQHALVGTFVDVKKSAMGQRIHSSEHYYQVTTEGPICDQESTQKSEEMIASYGEGDDIDTVSTKSFRGATRADVETSNWYSD